MEAGFLEAKGLGYRLDDGRRLFGEVTFRVGAGQVVALVGATPVWDEGWIRRQR